MNPSVSIGGKYFNSPMRHRSSNTETFKDFMETHLYRIEGDYLRSDIFIAIDHNENEIELLTDRRKKGLYNVLLRSEPFCVLPQAYLPDTETLYNRVVSMGRPVAENCSHWPQFWDRDQNTEFGALRLTDKAVLVNANKLSLFEPENYTLRRECIKKLTNLDFFGEGWNLSIVKRLRTLLIEVRKQPFTQVLARSKHVKYWFTKWPLTYSPLDKSEVIKKYKISVVIENEITYMSEKLFDAFLSGCIPVYVGPDVTSFGIPAGLVIQTLADVDSVNRGIQIAKSMNYEEYIRNLNSWLNLESTRENHHGEYIMKKIASGIIESYKEFTFKNKK